MGEDALVFLTGSAVRPEVLTALRERGRLSLRDLEARLSVSRRTLKRTLGQMEGRGWVRPRDGEYELTALGDAMFTAYETFRERERAIRRCRSFLEHTPADQFDAGVDALADVTLVSAESDPSAPVDRIVEIRNAATEIRQYAPFLFIDTVRQLADRATGESPLNATLVLGQALPDNVSAEYREQFEALAAAPGVDVYIYPDGPWLGLGVADGHAYVGVSDVERVPRALLEGDTPSLVAWVNQQLDRYLERAEPFALDS